VDVVGGGSTITDSVLFDHVEVGAGRACIARSSTRTSSSSRARRWASTAPSTRRGFTVTDSGITVVGKNAHHALRSARRPLGWTGA
jgi:glucose-1-phosphate adenylyltransferase